MNKFTLLASSIALAMSLSCGAFSAEWTDKTLVLNNQDVPCKVSSHVASALFDSQRFIFDEDMLDDYDTILRQGIFLKMFVENVPSFLSNLEGAYSEIARLIDVVRGEQDLTILEIISESSRCPNFYEDPQSGRVIRNLFQRYDNLQEIHVRYEGGGVFLYRNDWILDDQ